MKQIKTAWLLIVISALLSVSLELTAQWSPLYSVGTISGKSVFAYNQVPDRIVEIYPPLPAGGGLTYQWFQSDTPEEGFSAIVGATQSTYSFSSPLTQTSYFKCQVTNASADAIFSNVVKLETGSVNWEDRNYVREHDVLVPGITDWKAVDQLPIGQKSQNTTYLDGLGRPIQQIIKETATPREGSNLWGDMVKFYQYDAYGREATRYLPYTTTTEAGKFKTNSSTEQTQYYANVYNETSLYALMYYENSPLNRVKNAKSPGTSWSRSAGNSTVYTFNELADEVQVFTIGYNTGDALARKGTYAANELFKTIHTDENGRQVIEYTNKSAQVILTKTQIDDNPSPAHSGWICVYSIYDDFGLLRCRFQPEAVKYLDTHGWSFRGPGGSSALSELCFWYGYDDKGRNILKKAPGAKVLNMLYDQRDRVVFMQDGNQSLKNPPEWTANLYDELDRPVITALYKTGKSIADLQSDINASVSKTPVTIINPPVAVTDLVVDNRPANMTQRYAAQNTIEFTDGFESILNDEFTAEIDAAITQSYPVSTLTYSNPIALTDLGNASVCIILKYQFYDDYSFAGSRAFDDKFDNTTAYGTEAMPIVPSARTISYPTGSLVRVLNTNTFLAATEYYDEKGRHIQSIEDNVKSGKDITTFQYSWDGRLMSTHTRHSAVGGYTNFGILTRNLFDKIGRVTGVEKKYAGNTFKTIASYDFDDMGRLKRKHLDPGYSGSGKEELESLTYTYNIHNNITGINKDYALKTPGSYRKWDNFFGLYLGYDNSDNVFDAAQLNGQVAGLLWNTQGDDAQRKYDYQYDNTGRLAKATFNEKQATNDSWSNGRMDFSVSGRNQKIEYDLNGNLLFMLQKGVLPGSQSPVNIDDLEYMYSSYSNKLKSVTDNGTAANANGSFGDFKDGSNNINQPDYVYDGNGNVITDLNKNVKELGNISEAGGISYNFLDKPEEIHISGKGTIQLVYDADGNKLQKKYTPEGSTATRTTTYINQFVYEGDSLQYINFEEGRVRVIQPITQSNGYDVTAIDGNMDLPGGKKGVYDYYIRDYQENVRMILTEESHFSSGKCTMETGRASNEVPVFGQTGSANEVEQSRFPVADIPGQSAGCGWQNEDIGGSVSRLSKLVGQTIGPNSLLKVMAGDELSASTQYYYQNAVSNQPGSSLSNDVLNTLIQAISGSSTAGGLLKGEVANISSDLSGFIPFVNQTSPDAVNTGGNNPKAYLTLLFFDERFKFIEEGSTSLRVADAGSSNARLTLTQVKAPKNGYAYIYLSNESNEMVYFDNLQVAHNRGRIIEENHYYSFGLKIAGISSRKQGDFNEGMLDNKNLYNDKELIDEGDLDWYDYGFRTYDAQIGRFTQLDPLTDDYPDLTTYQYASNEPIANIDLDGLAPIAGLNGTVARLADVVVRSAPKISQAGQKIGGEIIKQAFKQGGKLLLKASLRAGGLLVSFLLTPLDAGNAKPSKPGPAGMIWGGDQWIAKPKSYFTPKENPNTPESSIEEDEDDQFIYRGGPASNANLTPRPIIPGKTNDVEGIKRGLSTFTSATEAMLISGANKVQKISVKALRSEGLIVDFIGTHASIRPATQKELEEWSRTRHGLMNGELPHVNTLKVKAAIISEINKPI